MSRSIVCMENVLRYYGDNPVLLEKYRKIAEGGKCPFCPGNIENELVATTTHWAVVHNQFPYKNARLHLLLLPKRHVTSLSELLPEELTDLAMAIRVATADFPELDNGYGLAIRDGEVGGVTLYHLHFHLIAPDIGEKGQIPVNFGIG